MLDGGDIASKCNRSRQISVMEAAAWYRIGSKSHFNPSGMACIPENCKGSANELLKTFPVDLNGQTSPPDDWKLQAAKGIVQYVKAQEQKKVKFVPISEPTAVKDDPLRTPAAESSDLQAVESFITMGQILQNASA